MPISVWPDFASCVKANQDKDNPEAYCAFIEQEIKKRRKEKELSDLEDGVIREEYCETNACTI